MQLAGVTTTASESTDPSARKERGPQDDKLKDDKNVFRALAAAGQRLAETHVRGTCCGKNNRVERTLLSASERGARLRDTLPC
jgi:hypothetical protein